MTKQDKNWILFWIIIVVAIAIVVHFSDHA